jgi:tetratricopeptide (TPR) repeat protein
MSQTRPAPVAAFTTALLLTQSEDFAVIDRRVLREAGIAQVRVMTSGVYAARFLAGREKTDQNPQPDIVLVHPQLADMSGADFARLIRTHPRLTGLPVLYVGSGDTPEEKLAALAREYSALLVRPYSGENMRQALEYAAACKAGRDGVGLGTALLNTEFFDKALEHFEIMLGACERDKPEDAFNTGLVRLRDRQWDEAIRAFQKALGRLALQGEAEYGIALAWKGKGDAGKYKQYLTRAGQTFTRAAKWQRARTVYARLLLEDPKAESPFLREAERLIRSGAFEEAAAALAEGYELTPKNAASERVARTLLYSGENPEKNADAFNRSLRDKAPQAADEFAAALREELEGQRRLLSERKQLPEKKELFKQGVPLGEEEADTADIPPAVLPLPEEETGVTLFGDKNGVNEILTVAKLTWKLFRAGKL